MSYAHTRLKLLRPDRWARSRRWGAIGPYLVLLITLATTAGNAQTVLPMPAGVVRFGGYVFATVIQPDGKIVVGG